SVRVAIGASRSRVIRLLVVETMTIALIGGLAGVVLAYWGGEIVRSAVLPDVVWSKAPVDARVLVGALIVTVITGLIVGLVPALRITRTDVTFGLRVRHS